MINCSVTNTALFDEIVDWLRRTAQIRSAVLFGSTASRIDSTGRIFNLSSDLDLHLIVTKGFFLEKVDWDSVHPSGRFCFQASRQTRGSVSKVTVIFDSGEI